MEREIDRRIGAASAVMWSVYRTVVVKKELSRKAKLKIYWPIYAPTLAYGHELWVMTEKTRSLDTSGRNEFPPQGWLGAPLERGREAQSSGRSSEFGRLPREVFQACPTGERDPRKTQDTLERLCLLAWECLGIRPEELEEVSGANPSPLGAESFSKVYSTARQAGQRKGPILLALLTHGKSAALPRALVSVLLLSRATDRGQKMGLEGTQHRALTFLIAPVEATGGGEGAL
ncbi:hypothetical protein L3Q82_001295 [Scortum barcoo]|uniref:Uncharacterized protein n=1 Tax=Scortum barcoo TaxID=214431 RepID=A0ACB8W713_9TELE|nr:hypothetical protein L3Q82_001295 [Scortum barcoo]